MRILKLEFENLNSLAGKWTIDFTHPDYARSHDIFVIHGPTGAGKTTILDAITLALYGRTPRLATINDGAGGNELMTRGTSFCRAQVMYSCKKGVFASEFQQKRAKAKASGRLQKVEYVIRKLTDDSFNDDRSLFDAAGEIVSSGTTGAHLEKETQRIIQLDYNQFCRSIMLAQGEFNTFLKSPERERAEILEKLTGTERYREIGKNIAAKFSEIKKSFSAKKAEKESVEALLLSPDALDTAKKQEAEYSAQLEQMNVRLGAIQKERAYYDELERLQKERDAAAAEFQAVTHERAAFAPNEERLTLAQAARHCEATFTALQNVRQDQAADGKKIDALVDRIAQAESSYASSERLAAQATEQLAAEEQDLAAQQIVWKKVRELDVRLDAATKKQHEAAERKSQAEQHLAQTTERLARLAADLAALGQSCADAQSYLAKHEADAQLPQVIAKIETLKTAAEAQQKKADVYAQSQADAQKKRDELQRQLDLAQKASEDIDAEIAAFVSADAVLIARLLQRELTVGKPCPVCGSVYHAAHKNAAQGELDLFGVADAELIDADKAREIAQTSSNLNARRDEARLLVQNVEAQLQATAAECLHAEENLVAARADVTERLLQINDALAPWNLTAELRTLGAIVADLRVRESAWAQKTDAFRSAEAEHAKKSAEHQTLAQGEQAQKETLADAEKAFAAAQHETQSLHDERAQLFGEKSVDRAETEKTEAIARLKERAAQAEKNQQEAKEEKARLEAQKDQLQKTVAERATTLQSAQESFVQKLAANGFADESAFARARMSDEDFSALGKKSESLKTRQTQAETALAQTQKSFADYQAAAQVTHSKDALRQEQDELSAFREELQQKLVEIKSALQTNLQNQERAEAILRDYAALQDEYAVWEQMKKWVGKDDGADLSVFVQSLAFRSLLALTNKNLYGITNRYRMRQKSAGSLDFEIEDVYFAEPRSVANLSGGEQFLVSLSLALGISEFASRNVRVDSLFLDEGFGTLSGDLLTEAINALKNLQKDGKMLGIITHVQDVINEIDQRIEVRQTSGGYSVLAGSGISRG